VSCPVSKPTTSRIQVKFITGKLKIDVKMSEADGGSELPKSSAEEEIECFIVNDC